MDGDLGFLRKSYEQFSVPGMLLLQNSKWHAGVYDYSPLHAGLAAGWETAVDDCIAALVPLARGNGGHIHGAQLVLFVATSMRWCRVDRSLPFPRTPRLSAPGERAKSTAFCHASTAFLHCMIVR